VKDLAGEVVGKRAGGDAWTGNNGASEVDGGDSYSGSLAETGRSTAWAVKGEGVFVGQRMPEISW
jgi:hypothetical protein